MKENTKEQIKDRMIKKAASLWGVAANEIEMSFDPIVSLLISACASEIEKISSEVDESQTRITEKVIQLMTPEASSGPTPAHAILQAEPVDDSTLIKPEFQFNYRKEETYKNTSVKYRDIYFSPVQEFNLVQAAVQYLVTGTSVRELDGKKGREVAKQDIKDLKLPPSTLYIGLSSELSAIPLQEVSLYFELQGVEDKELFYHHLRNAQWFINEAEVAVIGGFYNSDERQVLNLKSIFEDVSNKTNNHCQQILNNYARNYTTIKTTGKGKGIEKSIFSEVEQVFEENGIKTDGDIRWIKVVFPRVINNSILENVHCSLNSFPVLNRELNHLTYQIKEYINILPIKTEDLFFDMKSISNTEGKEYKAMSKDDSHMEKGTFMMRSDNIGKLDKRKAREYIVYLIELLKDESASFSFLNSEFLQNNLKGLNQLIALLEKKVSESSISVAQTNYVVLKPYKTNERLLVEYWTTSGNAGNTIKSGSNLSVYKGVGVKQGSCFLLTTSHGGKDDLSRKDRLNSYRRSLLSRDRVVTKEDVKALCHELYGEKIREVEIKRGYTNGIGENKGLIQCVEIILTPNNQMVTVVEEWDSINSNLMYYLQKNSINVFPYKIKILT